MKLTKNQDLKCTKCKNYLCCCGVDSFNHLELSNFCPNCGTPIEWITERTVEEMLEEVILEQLKCCFSKDKSQQEKADSLKQELLNKINK